MVGSFWGVLIVDYLPFCWFWMVWSVPLLIWSMICLRLCSLFANKIIRQVRLIFFKQFLTFPCRHVLDFLWEFKEIFLLFFPSVDNGYSVTAKFSLIYRSYHQNHRIPIILCPFVPLGQVVQFFLGGIFEFYRILTNYIQKSSLYLVYNSKIQKMKGPKNMQIENNRPTNGKAKQELPKAISRTLVQSYNVPCSPLRNQCVEWLYKAQLHLGFSRSTLFIGLGLLDKLLLKGLALTQANFELVSGSILLISTKFNEVYPITVRKLNILSKDEYSLKQFVEVEAAILQNIDFTVILEPIFEQLAELQAKYEGKQLETVEQLIKMAILNANETFKFGSASLLQAIQSLNLEGGLFERDANINQGVEVQSLRQSLTRLSSTHQRRLVSPSRF